METVEQTHRYTLPGPIAALGVLITTADGLGRWFADHAAQDGPWLTFLFEDDEPRARVLVQTERRLRFQWEAQEDFVDLRLSEAPAGALLEVTASTRADELEEARIMWDTSIQLLAEAHRSASRQRQP